MDQTTANPSAQQRATAAVSVPFFGLDRQYKQHRDKFLAIADEVFSTGQVLQGAPVQAFERSLSAVTGRRHAVAVGSCTDGIAFALAALGVGSGDEVIITAFSFTASASPILRVGATPRFVDVDPGTCMMDLAQVERAITKKTKAILAVHLFGQTMAMEVIEGIAERHGVALIEDAAQAIGTTYRGRRAGSMGRISCLSFDPTKVIGSYSSAGAVVTDDETLVAEIVKQRYHGRDPQTREYESLGYNSQLSSEMAAMLDFKLTKMVEWEDCRARIAAIYNEGLSSIPEIRLMSRVEGSSHNWHKYVLRTDSRDALAVALKRDGIQTMVHYPKALHDMAVFAGRSVGDAPEARRVAASVLSLPIFAELTDTEAHAVVDGIRRYFA
jgi:dTDP-4-amino-4,6-dideoxygalactose transaminase